MLKKINTMAIFLLLSGEGFSVITTALPNAAVNSQHCAKTGL